MTIRQLKLETKIDKLKTQAKQAKEYKKHLTELTNAVLIALKAIDEEMDKPSSNERGKRIAKICNELDMANDSARFFALGVDYRKDKKELREE